MREEIEARPSANLIIGLILGLIALNYFPAFAALIGFLIWLKPVKQKTILGFAFVVGLALSPMPAQQIQVGQPMRGIADVVSVPTLYPDAQSCEIRLNRHILQLTLPRSPGVTLGDHLRVFGVAKPMQASLNPRRSFDLAEGRIQMDEVQVVDHGSWVFHLADEWRRSFITFLDLNLSPKDASLVGAICFNARTMLDPQTKEEMAKSGTVHMLSASGLQVFVFGAMLSMALRFFPIPRSIHIGLLATILGVYALASGLHPQIVRAVAMTVMGMAAYLLGREPDAISALSISGIAYLLWRPESIYGMAFQLSFVAVGCIALFYQPTQKADKKRQSEYIRWANDYLKLSGVVMLATAPLIAYYLGVISIVSVFANLVTCWTLPILVGVAFVSHGVSLGVPTLGNSIASHFLSPVCHWIYGSLELLGDGSGGLQVPSFNPLWLVAYYVAWLMTYRRRFVQP